MSDPTPPKTPPSKEDLPEEFTSPESSSEEPSRKSEPAAKAEGSVDGIESTHDGNNAEKYDDAPMPSPPSSAELPPAFSPGAACTGSSIPTTSAETIVFSGGQETADSQASFLVAGTSYQAAKQGIDRRQEEPEILEWSQSLSSVEKATCESNGEIPTEGGATKERDEVLMQSETVQHEVGICRTASPPEYNCDIPISEFSKESNWEKKETYRRGNLDLETKMSLLTDVTQPTHYRTTSAVILLTVQNRKPECDYEARAAVALYDEKAGQILKESTVERKFEQKDYVKFIVDLGLHQDIEKSRSKKLQLQVKVRVDEKGTYKMFWEKLMVSCSMKR